MKKGPISLLGGGHGPFDLVFRRSAQRLTPLFGTVNSSEDNCGKFVLANPLGEREEVKATRYLNLLGVCAAWGGLGL